MRRSLCALLIALCSCATGGAVRERMRLVENDLAVARKQRADQCAPRDLAAAERTFASPSWNCRKATGAGRTTTSRSRSALPAPRWLAPSSAAPSAWSSASSPGGRSPGWP